MNAARTGGRRRVAPPSVPSPPPAPDERSRLLSAQTEQLSFVFESQKAAHELRQLRTRQRFFDQIVREFARHWQAILLLEKSRRDIVASHHLLGNVISMDAREQAWVRKNTGPPGRSIVFANGTWHSCGTDRLFALAGRGWEGDVSNT